MRACRGKNTIDLWEGKMEYKKRCFGLKKGKCTVLKIKQDCNTCVFHKTVDEKIEGERKARERCERLGIPYGDEYIREVRGTDD